MGTGMEDRDTRRDVDIIAINKTNFRYGQRECTVIKSDGMVVWYNFIVLNNESTLESHISEFTEFFFHKDYINLEINTKKNNYGTLIVSFLNYIFFDMENPLKSIDDFTIELGNGFLNKWGRGELSDRRTSNGKTIAKSDEVINQAKLNLTRFCYWLFNKALEGTRKKKYRLRNFKKTDFIWIEKKRGKYSKMCLQSIFTAEYPNKQRQPKFESPDEQVVYLLIELARQYDPMLALPIAMQSFVGVRRGEVCQISRERFHFIKTLGVPTGLYFDLLEESLLRKDGVRTGSIKRKRCQIAYEAFLYYFNKIYNDHLAFLKQRGLDCDVYGALLFGDNNMAMTTNTYARRFDALIPRLLERLFELKNHGNVQAARNYDLLLYAKLTPHALRYFFSDYVANHESSAHIVAMYRGDLNLDTALTYLRKSGKKAKEIKNIQNSFKQSYEKVIGKAL
jgi:integrase